MLVHSSHHLEPAIGQKLSQNSSGHLFFGICVDSSVLSYGLHIGLVPQTVETLARVVKRVLLGTSSRARSCCTQSSLQPIARTTAAQTHTVRYRKGGPGNTTARRLDNVAPCHARKDCGARRRDAASRDARAASS